MKKRFKLTLDVTLDKVEAEDGKNIEANLLYIISNAMGEGLVTGDVVNAEVESHSVRLTTLDPQKGEVKKRVDGLELLEDGNIRGVVRINVADLTEHESVLEKYLDIISDKLTGTTLLSDVRDQVVDVEDGSVLVVEVEGNPEFLHDCKLEGPIKELLSE
jgi:hypothetical protein